jgi:hypothetical protein
MPHPAECPSDAEVNAPTLTLALELHGEVTL